MEETCMVCKQNLYLLLLIDFVVKLIKRKV